MKKIIRIADCAISIGLILIYGLVAFGMYFLPNSVISYNDAKISYNSIFTVENENDAQVDLQSSARVSPQQCEIKLLGIIPVKTTSISYSSPSQVYVSGESFGIKLYTDGVIVVGTKDVDTNEGKQNPARQAGLEKGDIIVSINDVKMVSSTQVEEVFNDNNGKTYKIKVKRNGNYKTFNLTPVYSHADGKYKVGVWVRDSTAGIGTITFFNPSNSTLAALGHPITDVDTAEIMPILNGEAVEATVTKLYKSVGGEAGSLCCDFSNNVIGNLTLNSNCGVYGIYQKKVDDNKLYDIAPCQEVEKGSAKLLCTVDEKGPQFYDIEILRVSYRESNDDKNMVIKVTDSALLEKTGGIVQGMSGSPIIQNGRLVGALTHVIVDNPEKGFAIFAEKMFEKSQEVKAN